MKGYAFKLVYCALLLSMSSASAGVRGYRVVFIDLTPGQQLIPIFLKYRKITNLQSVSHCWDGRKGDWIDIAYVNMQPIIISPQTIKLAAAGDEASIKKFARLLSAYRDDEIASGFDGAYFATKEGGTVRINWIIRGYLLP